MDVLDLLDEEEKHRRPCEFCHDTGKHLCPDVVEPIVISCSKKGCFARLMHENIRALIEIAKAAQWIPRHSLQQDTGFHLIESRYIDDLRKALTKLGGGGG